MASFTATWMESTRTHTHTHTHTLELQMESANLSSTTDESRVQLMSLEYDEYRLDFRGQRGDLVGKQVRS